MQLAGGWAALGWIQSGEPVKQDGPAKSKDKVALDNR
jgi:hypothetical protein